MRIKSDIEIAQSTKLHPIQKVAESIGIKNDYLELYGDYKAKVDYNIFEKLKQQDGKLILVTAMTPTPAGEGKTTVTVGLGDALKKLDKKVM
jgi:formate--tetrahydrofolate ligase